MILPAAASAPLALGELLRGQARGAGDRVAIHAESGDWTYRRLSEAADRMAAGLHAQGVRAGERVALWMPSEPEWLLAFFALARLGAVTVAVNTRFRAHEIGDIFSRAGVRAVIYQPVYRGVDFAAVLGEVRATLPQLRLEVQQGGLRETGATRTVAFEELLAREGPLPEPPDADAIGFILTTSGTTRRPKLVMHRQSSMASHAGDVAASIGYALPGACAFNALPFSGTFGITQALACIAAGAPMVLQTTFDAPRAAALIGRHRVTLAAMTDEMIRRVYAAVPDARPFPGLRLFTGSRAAALVPLARERGFTILGLYGSSEAHAIFAHGHDTEDDERRTRGGGHPVAAETRVRATDLVTGDPLPHGVPGQLEFKGRTLTAGYWGDAEATAAAFTPDGWFRTGDLGATEADGSFHYQSRIGDALRLKGFLVNPAEIEEFVKEIEGVRECQVVGADGPDGQPQAVAFYLSHDGAPVDEGGLRATCRDRIASYKVPARFVHLEAFPLVDSPNAVKVNRNELRRRAAELLR